MAKERENTGVKLQSDRAKNNRFSFIFIKRNSSYHLLLDISKDSDCVSPPPAVGAHPGVLHYRLLPRVSVYEAVDGGSLRTPEDLYMSPSGPASPKGERALASSHTFGSV